MCEHSCAVYSGWDVLECEDESFREVEMERRVGFIDAT
jgi:hypothetical protein